MGRASRIVTLTGARVTAQPVAVLRDDGGLAWDVAPQLKRTPEQALAGAAMVAAHRQARRVEGRTFLATADGFSYYHWLFGTLPRLLAARAEGMKFDEYLVNPRHKGAVNFQDETLALVGVPAAKVEFVERGTHLVCDELSACEDSCPNEQTELATWAADLLRDAFLPPAGQATSGPRRIIVSRADARRRRLVDEDVLVTKLAPSGFVLVSLVGMPFLEQVRLFSGAEQVVGLHGAGLANLVFSAPGTRVTQPRRQPGPTPASRTSQRA